MGTIFLVVIVLLLGGGCGYYGYRQYGGSGLGGALGPMPGNRRHVLISNGRSQHPRSTASSLSVLSLRRGSMPRSKGHDEDSSHSLAALLSHLGVSDAVVEASIRRNEPTIARAAEIIADWMTYLPEDCVKAMVNDGWHWSV